MKKFFYSCFIALLCCVTVLTACNRPDGEDDYDDTKTALFVYNFDGGVGSAWLENVEKRFEAQYADVEFEPGKKGVDVRISRGKDLMLSTLSNQIYNVIFTEQVPYNDLISQKLIMDITDIVKDKTLSDVSGGKDTAKIIDKLSENQISAFTAVDGKHYVLPHYETYSGITYDQKVFYDYKFYFKAGGVNAGWTNVDAEKSVGPDGIKGSFDDGLPSSYEEFYKLIERMANLGVAPFIWAGGLNRYTDHLVTGIFAQYSGKEEFMLNFNYGKDSQYTGPGKARIVTGFNGSIPIIEEKEIRPETGYLLSQQAGKYYAYEVLDKVLSDIRYRSEKMTGVMTHLEAQTEFVYSDLENNPIGMLIEGSYWYNEASDAFRRSQNQYRDKAVNRRFAFMPLPVQASGQVAEGQGKKGTVADSNSAFAFINANIQDDEVKSNLAKLFLQFCYTDESLLDFTKTTGILKGVEYEVDKTTYDGLDNYFQSLIDIKRSYDVVYPYSDNKMFVYSPTLLLNGSMYTSTVNNEPYQYPFTALEDGISAKDYFLGGSVDDVSWRNKFGQYFN